jgi:hypothetical protein
VTAKAGKLSRESAGVADNIRVLSHLSDNRITYEADQSQTPLAALSTALTNAQSLTGTKQTPAYSLATNNAAAIKANVATATANAKANADTLKINVKTSVDQATINRLNDFETSKLAYIPPLPSVAASIPANRNAANAAAANLVASNLAEANARTAAFAAAAVAYTAAYVAAAAARIPAHAAMISIHGAASDDMANTGRKNCDENETAFHIYDHVATAEAAVAAQEVETAA